MSVSGTVCHLILQVTECILNLLDPSTACGGGGAIIFIDLVSTDILLAMLVFPLPKKGMLIFVFKPSRLFLFSTALIAIVIYGWRGTEIAFRQRPCRLYS